MAEMKFEDALKKLEKIVSELEGGELSLDESLKRHEEGVKLSRILSKELEAAKKKVEVLVKKDDGKFDLEPFNTNEL